MRLQSGTFVICVTRSWRWASFLIDLDRVCFESIRRSIGYDRSPVSYSDLDSSL